MSIKIKNGGEALNRLRNKAVLVLSLELKRMPSEDEVTLRVCEWRARAYPGVPVYRDEPEHEDMYREWYEQYGVNQDDE